MLHLGVVSYLNSKPLIEGLSQRPDIRLTFQAPARLASRLEDGEFDAALIPVVDVLRGAGRLSIVSDACIGCDGETMTVRVFSQTSPHRLRVLHVDNDSHTSVALARILWREIYGIDLELRPLEALGTPLDTLEAVLLIGDKVVDPRRSGFAYEVDLGGAWRQHTGLPFVFAAWAATEARRDADFSLLGEARDRGVARAAEIAAEQGPALGWPVSLAERYLCRRLTYRMDGRYAQGVERFAQLGAELGLWPAYPGPLVETADKPGARVFQ